MILKVIGGWWVQSEDDGDVCGDLDEIYGDLDDVCGDLDDVYGDCADDYDSSDGQSPVPIKVFWETLISEHELEGKIIVMMILMMMINVVDRGNGVWDVDFDDDVISNLTT